MKSLNQENPHHAKVDSLIGLITKRARKNEIFRRKYMEFIKLKLINKTR